MWYFLLSFAVLTVAVFYVYRKFYVYRLFTRLGIPGPEPHWLFGNVFQLLKEDRHLIMAKWSSRYGPFFGYYWGTQPILVTSSVEAVESICVKQSSDFQGHLVFPIQPDADTDPEGPLNHMLFAYGERWKRLRTICNPAFSCGKMKSYMNLILKSQDDFMELLESKAKLQKQFDIWQYYQFLTLDTLGEVGFGLEFNAVKNQGEGNVILKNIRSFFTTIANPPSFVSAAVSFTGLVAILRFIFLAQIEKGRGLFAPLGHVMKAVGEIVDQRKSQKIRRNDILQMMVDAVPFENAEKLSNFRSLSERELVAQCLLLFIGGYEGTSSSLAFASYFLAKNPDAQEKLAEEVHSHFFPGPDGKFPQLDYETVMNKMPYLDWVCNETLRIYPIGMNLMSRFVTNETSLCGINVPKSIKAVFIDTWTIHHDEALWGPVDTNKFYPERFSPENSTGRPDSAFLAFGFGPRQCLGMRLALLEMKITLANILLRFRITEPDGGYPNDNLPITSRGSLAPIGGIHVKLLPRV